MPQLSISYLADGTGSLAAKINALIDAIIAAYNKLDTTNFNSSSNIPSSALARPKAYFVITLKKNAVAASQPVTTIQDEFHLPCDCDLADVRVVAADVLGGDVKVDVYLVRGSIASPDVNESILSAQMDLPAAGTIVKDSGTISRTSFLEGDLLSMRAVTDVGETIEILDTILLFKAKHTS